jgi:hypothetical protein
MPYRAMFKAGKKMYDDSASKKSAPRAAQAAPAKEKAPPPPKVRNQAKANVAADALRVPGRDVVRGAMARRKAMLDDL